MMGVSMAGFPWMGGSGMMFIWWILIICGIVAVLMAISDKTTDSKTKKLPLEILKERYAQGKINKAEYEEKKKDIQ